MDVSPVLDTNILMIKSASLHMEMVFSRILRGSDLHRQGSILEAVAGLVVKGRMRPIVVKRLSGLTCETMREAHELIETTRTIGKVVIATD